MDKKKMKKYTIIYNESITIGSRTNQTTHLTYIYCKPEDLSETVETSVGWGNVWFVIDGHIKQTED